MENTRLINLLGALAVGASDALNAEMAAKVHLEGSALAALLTVHTRPGNSIDELARTLGLTHSATVRSVDRLAALDLVERRSAATDKRAVSLFPTRKGRSTAGTALRARRTALTAMLAGLDEGEARQFESLLARVLAALPTDQGHAHHICRLCEHAVCRGRGCPVGSAVDTAAAAGDAGKDSPASRP